MKVSVIIPTYNRNISKCLEGITKQNFDEYEVIVVNDGGDGVTRRLKDHYKQVQFVEAPHKGPAHAKNVGIKLAKGKYVIFIGDDIITGKMFVKSHFDFLEAHKGCASAGATMFHPETNNALIFPTLHKLGLGNFTTPTPEDCGWWSFTTSNVGVPRSYLKELFDEKFPYPAFEDNELGYRLYKVGLVLKYNPLAVAYHYHIYNKQIINQRMSEMGSSIAYFTHKHPELRRFYIKSPFTYLAMHIAQLCPFAGIYKDLSDYALRKYYAYRQAKEHFEFKG